MQRKERRPSQSLGRRILFALEDYADSTSTEAGRELALSL